MITIKRPFARNVDIKRVMTKEQFLRSSDVFCPGRDQENKKEQKDHRKTALRSKCL